MAVEKVTFRAAVSGDLAVLVDMLASDPLGADREVIGSQLHSVYIDAFSKIDADPDNDLIVATLDDRIVGMMQLTLTQYLTHAGSRRATVEGVRVQEQFRSRGIGELMIQHAVKWARDRRCAMIQLTSDKSRAGAIRFYQRLGFVASHEGMKLQLDGDNRLG